MSCRSTFAAPLGRLLVLTSFAVPLFSACRPEVLGEVVAKDLVVTSHTDGFVIDRAYARIRGTCIAGSTISASVDAGLARVVRADCDSSGVLRVNVKFVGAAGSRSVRLLQTIDGFSSPAVTLTGTLSTRIRDVGAGREYTTIQSAVAAASAGEIVALDPGEYVEGGQLLLDKNLSLEGHLAEDTIYKLGANRPDIADDASCWVLIPAGNEVTIRGINFHGNGMVTRVSFRIHGRATFENNIFHDHHNRVASNGTAGSLDRGIALLIYNDTVVRNNWFREVQRASIFLQDVDGAGPKDGRAEVLNNTFTGKQADVGQYKNAVALQTGGDLTFTGNKVEDYDQPWAVEPSIIINAWQAHSVITRNEFGTMNSGGLVFNVGGLNATHLSVMQYNRITGNWPTDLQYGAIMSSGTAAHLDLRYNWWGHSSGPYHATDNPSATGQRVHVPVANTMDFSGWLTDASQAGITSVGYQPLD